MGRDIAIENSRGDLAEVFAEVFVVAARAKAAAASDTCTKGRHWCGPKTGMTPSVAAFAVTPYAIWRSRVTQA